MSRELVLLCEDSQKLRVLFDGFGVMGTFVGKALIGITFWGLL